MKVPRRQGPPQREFQTEAGLFLETALLGLPPAGAEPLRICGRSLGQLFERRGWFEVDFTRSLRPAVAALRCDVARLERFVTRVTAGARENEHATDAAKILCHSGLLLRQIVRELEAHSRPSALHATQQDLEDV